MSIFLNNQKMPEIADSQSEVGAHVPFCPVVFDPLSKQVSGKDRRNATCRVTGRQFVCMKFHSHTALP